MDRGRARRSFAAGERRAIGAALLPQWVPAGGLQRQSPLGLGYDRRKKPVWKAARWNDLVRHEVALQVFGLVRDTDRTQPFTFEQPRDNLTKPHDEVLMWNQKTAGPQKTVQRLGAVEIDATRSLGYAAP